MTSTSAGSLSRRPAPSRRLLGFAVAGLAVVAAAIALVLLGGSGSSGSGATVVGTPDPTHPAATYGGVPKWLPTAKAPADRVVNASAAAPKLAIQGDTVSVHLAGGKVLATAVGPQVPEEGQFPVPSTSPCSFVLTFAAASHAVPIDPAAFTITDDNGHVHHPNLRSMSGGPPPRRAPAGRTVSMRVNEVLPTGNGALSWSPAGGKPIVSWDFDVEID